MRSQTPPHRTSTDLHAGLPSVVEACVARAIEASPTGPGLVTLIGDTGAGKSHTLLRLSQQPDWVYVDLCGLSTPEGVLDAILQGLGASSPRERRRDQAQACAVLVLDNADAGQDICTHIVRNTDVLSDPPRCLVVGVSEPLGADHEQVISAPLLDIEGGLGLLRSMVDPSTSMDIGAVARLRALVRALGHHRGALWVLSCAWMIHGLDAVERAIREAAAERAALPEPVGYALVVSAVWRLLEPHERLTLALAGLYRGAFVVEPMVVVEGTQSLMRLRASVDRLAKHGLVSRAAADGSGAARYTMSRGVREQVRRMHGRDPASVRAIARWYSARAQQWLRQLSTDEALSMVVGPDLEPHLDAWRALNRSQPDHAAPLLAVFDRVATLREVTDAVVKFHGTARHRGRTSSSTERIAELYALARDAYEGSRKTLALQLLREASTHVDEFIETRTAYDVYLHLGWLQAQLGSPASAVGYLWTATVHARALDDPAALIDAQCLLARALAQSRESNAALEIYDGVLEHAHTTRSRSLVASVCARAALVCLEIGARPRARAYLARVCLDGLRSDEASYRLYWRARVRYHLEVFDVRGAKECLDTVRATRATRVEEDGAVSATPKTVRSSAPLMLDPTIALDWSLESEAMKDWTSARQGAYGEQTSVSGELALERAVTLLMMGEPVDDVGMNPLSGHAQARARVIMILVKLDASLRVGRVPRAHLCDDAIRDLLEVIRWSEPSEARREEVTVYLCLAGLLWMWRGDLRASERNIRAARARLVAPDAWVAGTHAVVSTWLAHAQGAVSAQDHALVWTWYDRIERLRQAETMPPGFVVSMIAVVLRWYVVILGSEAGSARAGMTVSTEADPASLRISYDGSTIVLATGVIVDLKRRPVLTRLMRALAAERLYRPGVSVSAEVLIQSGWPHDTAPSSAQRNRLYVSIRRLRRAGLGAALERHAGGYRLSTTMSVSFFSLTGASAPAARSLGITPPSPPRPQ